MFKNQLKAEWLKISTTKTWWILGLGLAVYVMVILGGFGFAVAGNLEETGQSERQFATGIYTGIHNLGYVFALLIGALATTSEYRHKTLSHTFTLNPQRSQVMGTKLLVVTAFGALYGVIATFFGGLAVALALKMQVGSTYLTDTNITQILGVTIVLYIIWALIGAGIGGIIKSQVGTIVMVLAFTQFVEPIARAISSNVDALEGFSRFLPSKAADGFLGSSFYSSGETLLSQPIGGTVMVAYAVVVCIIGIGFIVRRDVKE